MRQLNSDIKQFYILYHSHGRLGSATPDTPRPIRGHLSRSHTPRRNARLNAPRPIGPHWPKKTRQEM